ncbi:MAG: hypothetical protein IAE90_03715 [Ignavibacteria bacterium]|nr:hypothetical protein [Ignavibacteria bacterium]
MIFTICERTFLLSLSKISVKAEEFLNKAHFAFYLQVIGKNISIELSGLYNEYNDLFSIETIQFLRETQKENLASQNRASDSGLKYLTEFISCEFVNLSNLELKQQLQDTLSTADCTYKVKQYTYSGIKQLNFWEGDNEKEALEKIIQEFCENKLNNLLAANLLNEQSKIRELGYRDHSEMFVSLTGINISSLKSFALRFLADTSNTYFSHLEKLNVNERIQSHVSLSRDELYMLLSNHSKDECFTSIEPNEVFDRFAARSSFEPEIISRIKIEQIQSSGRAFCSVLNAPHDIRLVIQNGRGLAQMRDLLHETGHALHYASVDSSLPFEFRRLGDDSITEAYAALFENLLYDEIWVNNNLLSGGIQKSELISFLKFYKLTKLRNLAVKLIYDNELYCNAADTELKQKFRHYYKEYLGVEVNEYEYLSETEPFLFSARYFRAQMLAANLKSRLETSFGSDWFENKEAFKFLSMIWKTGQQFSAEEVSESFTGIKIPDADITNEFNV